MNTVDELPDLSGFLMGHAAMRREFGLLADVAQGAPDGPRARLAEDQLALVLAFVHAHHAGEDRDVWPLLRERAPGAARELDALEAEHEVLDPLMAAAGDTSRSLAARAADLRALHERLGEHLDHEERVVLPLLRERVGAAEWRALERRATRGLDVRRFPTVVGWLTSAADEDQLRAAARGGPVVLRLLLRLWWRPAYRRRARALYGR